MKSRIEYLRYSLVKKYHIFPPSGLTLFPHLDYLAYLK
ncbi:hypothetical protein BN1221_04997 [Brenneria goodwinii]|uniref:Uncharacterized protein n=1 Tax=Brenneria goodwinii TaxID=1109412 RepID=A0A0G4K2Y5_9GAMM|nr:hypothetical protein BN1221_04997 [Brenneria goodwinii]